MRTMQLDAVREEAVFGAGTDVDHRALSREYLHEGGLADQILVVVGGLDTVAGGDLPRVGRHRGTGSQDL